MKLSQLKQIIKEEIKDSLNEASNLESKVADLYGYAGVKTQYDDDMVKRYGQKVIDLAVEMAPKILAYESELKNIVKQMEASPEAKMLLRAMSEARGYSGGRSYVSLGDLINRYTKD
jgi:hypothetical protein